MGETRRTSAPTKPPTAATAPGAVFGLAHQRGSAVRQGTTVKGFCRGPRPSAVFPGNGPVIDPVQLLTPRSRLPGALEVLASLTVCKPFKNPYKPLPVR